MQVTTEYRGPLAHPGQPVPAGRSRGTGFPDSVVGDLDRDGVPRAADIVTIEIIDNGIGEPGSQALAGGHGLAGMRERAAVFGGELAVGPRPDGGFGVRARLPLGDRQLAGELS